MHRCMPAQCTRTRVCLTHAHMRRAQSTLMDIVSARKSVGRLSGDVLVNGAPRSADFARKTAYVPQVRCCQCCLACLQSLHKHAMAAAPRKPHDWRLPLYSPFRSLTTSCRP